MKIFEKMTKEGIRKIEVKPDFLPIPETKWLAKIMEKEGHEKVYLFCYPEVKLRAAIAIHNRAISPQALGGIRMFPYLTEEEALRDVLQLSKAMTYKSAMAGVEKGGAKCVIWGDPKNKTDCLLATLASEIEKLAGEYIGGEDMNIDERNVLFMKKKTSFVVGLPENFRQGKLIGSGNPSPVTARGVIFGMKACLGFKKMGSLKGKIVTIQGVGHVGRSLAEFLCEEGVREIIVTDIDPSRITSLQKTLKRRIVRSVNPEEIFSEECDIFAPCARGGVLNKETIPFLRCEIVAGAANNQLQNPADGKLLMKRGILYAPDYVINAGGLINVDDELHPDGYNRERVEKKLENIPRNLLRVFWHSQRLNMPTNQVADLLAEEKIWLSQQVSK